MTHPDRHDAVPNIGNPLIGRGLSAHILPTSATMVGVCMTVLAIRHLAPGTDAHVIIDKLLAIDALLFLFSGIFSFSSIRSPLSAARLERYAEQIFLIAQGLLALGAVGLAFVIT
ncbi:MAG: hypothetical protein NVSMB6_29290 [Burkholderiaceae bacterium]